ncbi:unnamed protein product [Cunninghamella blakesleeana]
MTLEPMNHLSIYRSKSTGTMHHVPRRLSSGSACETCRRRKTKCDGGQPCAFCSSNNIECIHRPSRRKRSLPKYTTTLMNHQNNPQSSTSSSSSSPTSSTSPSPSSSKIALDPSTRYYRHPWSVSPPPLPNRLFPNTTNTEPSSPTLMKQISCPSLFINSKKMEMPSMMDQLSCRTFSAVTLAASEHKQAYPIFHLHSDFDHPY